MFNGRNRSRKGAPRLLKAAMLFTAPCSRSRVRSSVRTSHRGVYTNHATPFGAHIPTTVEH